MYLAQEILSRYVVRHNLRVLLYIGPKRVRLGYINKPFSVLLGSAVDGKLAYYYA